jgi:hypothetical protein
MNDKVRIILVGARVHGELLLPDNLTGRCDFCDYPVQYRPHAPKNHVLRCMQCAAELLEDDDDVTSTLSMIEDAKAYFRKREN